jgi:hypothetical protein
MSTTLLGVFVGSVLGAVALVVYSVALLLEGRRPPQLATTTATTPKATATRPRPRARAATEKPDLERLTRKLVRPPEIVDRPSHPAEPVVRPLPGLPPITQQSAAPPLTWGAPRPSRFLAVGSVAEPLRRVPRASSPPQPQFRRAVFIDQEFADDAPTQQLARPFMIGRPARGRA